MTTIKSLDLRTRARRSSSTPPWMEKPSRIGRVVKIVVLVIILLMVVYPFWVVLVTSFSSRADITEAGGLVSLPHHLTFESYAAVFNGGIVTRALLVSIGVTAVGTLVNLIVTIAMAYGLSRPTSFAHRPILLIALFTMLFSAGIIPNFLLVKSLGMLDTYASLIVPSLVSAFNLVVMRNFFMNIPSELIDSARIDGAGDLKILLRIVLPLSKAVIAVIALFEAVGHWNSFFNALLYLSDNTKWPLALVLRAYVLEGEPTTSSQGTTSVLPPEIGVQMAVVMIAVVPILIVYPFLQKYFTKGVLTGAVKG